MKMKNYLLAGTVCLALLACGEKKAKEPQLTKSGLNPEEFVAEYNGKATELVTLTNENGLEVCITNFGGRIVSLMVPDKTGELKDVVLGFDKVTDYFPENNASDFGAAIGRYANRIGQGRFVLEGDTIQLPINNNGHCLHGGPTGWQYQVYDVAEKTDNCLKLVMHSPNGDNNFPGNLEATVTYELTHDNRILISYQATTDKPTVINMTNHSYFNLNGDPTQNIEDVLLTVNADGYTPADKSLMTTGEILPVEGTPLDFRTAKTIGQDINSDFEQVVNGNGYDHNWVLNTAGDWEKPCAVAESTKTGIVLTVYTDEPGIQVYTGNFLNGIVTGKHGVAYPKRAAVCLETQHYPDSPNKPEWPSTELKPGEVYSSHTIFAFSVKK